MDYKTYIDTLRNKNIAVIGIGVSNIPLIETFVREGLQVTACDIHSYEEIKETADNLSVLGVKLRLGKDYLENLNFDYIFRAPSLLPFEEHLEMAAKNGTVITSEMEAFFEICPCKIFAVTGSDGKTTTTTIIYELLKKEGYKTHVGGNIGTPLFSVVNQIKEDDMVVLELSSFQLYDMKCKPKVSVITNISPNHLDKHKDYQDYIDAKMNIFINQTKDDILVLNMKDGQTKYYENKSNATIRHFVRNGESDNGYFSLGNKIYKSIDGSKEYIMDVEDIKIPGVHNIENYLAAFSALDGYVSVENCIYVAKNFGGVEHRLEFVRNVNGVKYINDSIGSSPSRTIAGLNAMKTKPILIVGGYDKKIPFDSLGDEICLKCKAVFITGATSEKIYNAIVNSANYNNSLDVFVIDDFTKTVKEASKYAVKNDIVLLSPACAAFDKFKNFAERGKYFKKIVYEL